jgi:hypothetical protein
MTVRAKFRVNNLRYDGEGKPNGVTLSPVYDSNPESENGKFFSATPGGTIDLWVTRAEVAGQFALGQEFHVDFTPAG